jgi:hypothetical protein
MPPAAAAGVGLGAPVLGGLINAFGGSDQQDPRALYGTGGQEVAGDLSGLLRGQLAGMPELNIEELLRAVQGIRGQKLPDVPTPGFSPEVQEMMRKQTLANLAPGEEQSRLNVKDLLGEYGPSTVGLQTAQGVESDIGRNRGQAMTDLEKYFQTTGFDQGLQSREANIGNIMFPMSLEQSLLGSLSGVRNNMINQALDFSRPIGQYNPQGGNTAAGIASMFGGVGDTAAEFGRGGAFEGAFGGGTSKPSTPRTQRQIRPRP